MRIRTHVCLLAVTCASLCVQYAPVYDAGFIYEDFAGREEQFIGDLVSFGSGGQPRITWAPRSMGMLTVIPTDGSPTSLRLTNVAMHVTIGLCLWMLLARLGCSMAATWVGSMLFVLNPLAMEAVGYISGRSELVAALGIIVAAICMTLRDRWWILAALALSIGLLGKHTAIVGLALAPLVYATRSRRQWIVFLMSMPLLAYGASVFAEISQGRLADVGWMDWLLIQATGAYRYTLMSVWAWQQQTPDFDYDVVPRLLQYASLASLALMAGAVVALRRMQPIMSLGLAWMLIAIVPRLVVQTPTQPLTEHQWYASLIGFGIVCAGAWDALSRGQERRVCPADY